MFNRAFLVATGYRAIWTVTQAALALLTVDALTPESILTLDWRGVLIASATAGGLSILKSVSFGVPEAYRTGPHE